MFIKFVYIFSCIKFVIVYNLYRKKKDFSVRGTTEAVPFITVPFILKDLSKDRFSHSMKPFPTEAIFSHLFVLNSSNF